jgi:hypothetical protein
MSETKRVAAHGERSSVQDSRAKTVRAQGIRLAEAEKAISALGYGTENYHNAMAYYLMTMARAQWRLADLASRRQQ